MLSPCHPLTLSPCQSRRSGREAFDQPVRVFVAELERVLADDEARLAVAGARQGPVVEAPPGQRQNFGARRIQEQHGALGNVAAEHDAADAEVALVDADQALVRLIRRREESTIGLHEAVDRALLGSADDDQIYAAVAALPDLAQRRVELRFG